MDDAKSQLTNIPSEDEYTNVCDICQDCIEEQCSKGRWCAQCDAIQAHTNKQILAVLDRLEKQSENAMLAGSLNQTAGKIIFYVPLQAIKTERSKLDE